MSGMAHSYPSQTYRVANLKTDEIMWQQGLMLHTPNEEEGSLEIGQGRDNTGTLNKNELRKEVVHVEKQKTPRLIVIRPVVTPPRGMEQ